MSQRLLIGITDKIEYWDCIIDKYYPREELLHLLAKWIMLKIYKDEKKLSRVFYIKPFKISIKNKELFFKIEPVIKELFILIDQKYPNSVWGFYYNNKNIEHPTIEELNEFLK